MTDKRKGSGRRAGGDSDSDSLLTPPVTSDWNNFTVNKQRKYLKYFSGKVLCGILMTYTHINIWI